MSLPKILLLTPPMTQLNTPYPATAYLTGFMQSLGYPVAQRDPAIELLHRLLSKAGLKEIREELLANFESQPPELIPDEVQLFLEHFAKYEATINPCLKFLRGLDPSMAMRIASRRFLPEYLGFQALHSMEAQEGEAYLHHAFGLVGVQDKAKYLASLYLAGLVGVIRAGIDPRFELSRYGERLAASNPLFDDLYEAIHGQKTYVDDELQALVLEYLREENPRIVGLSLPFPGNVYAGFRIAQTVKGFDPSIKIIMGGGFVNTELRSLKDPRVFEYVDFICFDDGERPLKQLIEHCAGLRPLSDLVRTFTLVDGEVTWLDHREYRDIPHNEEHCPTYEGLDLSLYLSLCEMPNPMQRIWSDGRWNKLTLAHGCYWKGCSFCDTSLDYISRYEEAEADILLRRMQKLRDETKQSGFHFVDEAAPPKILAALAHKIKESGETFSWWGNVRFERSFTPKLTRILAESGCIAVSGGLEVASDRLLKLMNKGVTIQQVARVTKAFAEAGVLVHAYLMYGFPSQTEQETIDALEYVRQLFLEGCLDSAYWHRFAATVHSPVGKNPEAFGVTLQAYPEILFATNDIEFTDSVKTDHDRLGIGLKRALYNYMQGMGLEEPLKIWFDHKTPKTTVPRDLIARSLL